MEEKTAQEVKVSVIVPVYNAEKYLEQCLDSIVSQTLKDIEIICVDDGSTDRSVEMLKKYAENDARVKILYQDHKFAGTARNLGKSTAKGKYLVFWDADDFFKEEALEKMYVQCEADEADICICSAMQYFEHEDFIAPGARYVRKSEIPDTIPFNRKTSPDHVVSITVEAPWNKMFRRQFIEDKGIDFKGTRNANDVFFVETALCLADRITLVTEDLIIYRKSKGSGLVASVSKGLMNALHTWTDTAEYLKKCDALPTRSFANRALESVIYLLNNTTEWEAFREGYEYLQNGGLDTLEIRADVEDDYYYVDYYKEAARRLREDSPEQYSKWIGNLLYKKEAVLSGRRRNDKVRFLANREKWKSRALRSEKYEKLYNEIKESEEYKLGCKVKRIRDKFRHRRQK